MARKKDEIVIEQTDETTKTTTQEATHEITPEVIPPQDEETITLSSKELENRINKGRIEIGRQLKTALEAQSALQRSYDSQRGQLSTIEQALRQQKQRERERELKSVENQPEVLDSIRIKHQAEDAMEEVTKKRSEFEAEKAQHQAAIDRALKTEADTLAKELAKESGLAATLLLQIASDTSDGRTIFNLERMKSIAKSVPKESSETEEETEEGAEKEPTAVRGQRSRAAGTGGRAAGRGFRTFEDYEEAFIKGEISYEQYQEAAKRFNKQI